MRSWESGFDHEIDEYIDAFESAWQIGSADSIDAFLPPMHHPKYAELVVELARIDLERRWGLPDRKSLSEYFSEFPEVFDDPDRRAVLAFEEFRLRRLQGEDVSPESYAREYGFAANAWPDVPVGSTDQVHHPETDAWSAEVSQWEVASRQRLAAARKRLPSVGQEFLGFELVGVLGEGALGRVYLARQGDLSRRFVALKVAVHPSDEPQRLAQLQHSNIVPIYSCHRDGPLQATCMPFLGANTLADVLRSVRSERSVPQKGEAFVSTLVARNSETVIREVTEEKQSSNAPKGRRGLQVFASMSYVETVVWVAERMTHALAHAHEHGVVHCDLKPANVVLTDEGEPLLVDFHLAAEYSDGAGSSYVVGGTLPYMAPEHLEAIRHGGRVAPSSDVYSIGVMLFEMLTGELPFPQRAGLFEEVADQLIEDRHDLKSVADRLAKVATPATRAIVLKCLQPDPAQRYPTATELHEDLHCQLGHRPLRHIHEPSLRERIAKWSRRHPRISSASTLTAVALVALLLLAVGWRSTHRELAQRSAQLAYRQLEQVVTRSEAILTAPEATIDQWRSVARDLDRNLAAYDIAIDSETWHPPLLVKSLPGSQQEQVVRELGRAAAMAALSEARLALHAEGRARQDHWQRALALTKRARQLMGSTPWLEGQAARLRRLAKGNVSSEESPEGGARDTEMASPAATASDSYLAALALFEQGELSAAAAMLERLADNDPRRWSLWFGLGSCYYAMGRFRDAESAYTTAMALFPESTQALAYRGLARLKQHRYHESARDLQKAVRLAPERPDFWINLALAQLGARDVQTAIASLDRAIELDAESVRAYLIRARAKEQLGDREGAAADRKTALSKEPRDALGWVARGMAALQDDPKEALHDFQTALELDPRSPEALQNTATILADFLNRPQEAVPYVSRLIELQPQEPAHLAWRGVLLARAGRRNEAHRDAQRALKQNLSPLTTLQVACIYALTSRSSPPDSGIAVRLVRQALSQRPLLVEIAAADPDLAPIRNEPEFRQLVEAASLLKRGSPAGDH